MSTSPTTPDPKPHDPLRPRSDKLFYTSLMALGGAYVLLIIGLLLAMLLYASPARLWSELIKPETLHAGALSLLTCTATAVLSLWVAVPIGYLMSRHEFRGKVVLDALLDIPIVLPPLVIGLLLLVLSTALPRTVSDAVVFEWPAVVLAQFTVAAAFAVRTMRATFDQIPQRLERVALTLGASRGQAFWTVVLPEARRGIIAAGTLAWARALGEFGPILIFAGMVPMRTEVLTSTVYLEFQSGNLVGGLAVSLIMVILAAIALVIIRLAGTRGEVTP
jgi:molybdate transport system permease protein